MLHQSRCSAIGMPALDTDAHPLPGLRFARKQLCKKRHGKPSSEKSVCLRRTKRRRGLQISHGSEVRRFGVRQVLVRVRGSRVRSFGLRRSSGLCRVSCRDRRLRTRRTLEPVEPAPVEPAEPCRTVELRRAPYAQRPRPAPGPESRSGGAAAYCFVPAIVVRSASVSTRPDDPAGISTPTSVDSVGARSLSATARRTARRDPAAHQDERDVRVVVVRRAVRGALAWRIQYGSRMISRSPDRCALKPRRTRLPTDRWRPRRAAADRGCRHARRAAP